MDLNFNHPVKALIVDVDQNDPGFNEDKIKLTTSGVEIAKMTEDQMVMTPYWHNSQRWYPSVSVMQRPFPRSLSLSIWEPTNPRVP